MRPPCEDIVQRFLPAFRCLVTKELIEKHKLSQVEVARILGTTQAAISQYLGSKRGFKDSERLRSIPSVIATAVRVAKELVDGDPARLDVNMNFCKVCLALRECKNLYETT
ncbi:MAG: transcriptional regulator [Candidatus Bathyarchaeia archaeon]